MPPHEQTPLIQTVIIAQPRQRYSHNYIRRFCSAALGIVLVIVIVLFLVPARWLPGNRSEQEWIPINAPWSSHLDKSWSTSDGLTYEELQRIILETPSTDRVKEWSQYYTAGPHLAGKNLSQAEWTRSKWEEFGISANIVAYEVYINYPVSNRLALLKDLALSSDRAGPADDGYAVTHECIMEEDVLKEDHTSGLSDRVPTFHGYSASGNVTAQYVYVNFGTYWDYEDLVKANVTLQGKIALAKYGRNFRGLKVKRAQELGMIGIVMYDDPQQDGKYTEYNGYKPYPDGPARQPSSVQRGSVEFLSIAPGDPTTPGYPSKPGSPRMDPYEIIPLIPSVPISYREALPLLRALNGQGPQASDFNQYWQGGGLGYKGVQYNIGPSQTDDVLNLVNEQEYTTTPLWNVIGVINGTLIDEVIVIGNHRDAWIAGGAGDPNSGSAAMNEIIRSFGIALKAGWKPLRTIVFASWDGEEYGLIGSTEWVEEYLPWLTHANVAYLNIDVGASGSQFSSAASPLLNKAIYEATSLVQSPNQTVPGQTVRDVWDGNIHTMGSGSDFTAFQDFAGIPSVDMGFAFSRDSPVYHYHSNYDSFAWMSKFGDPTWEYHVAIAKVLGLLAASLAETPVIGFNATDYADGLSEYIGKVKNTVVESDDSAAQPLTEFPLIALAISEFHSAAVALDARAASLAAQVRGDIPWWQWWRKARLFGKIKAVNAQYKYLERHFLYEKGLDGRNWFKHVVFAPGLWTGYAGATFPGLHECLEAGDEAGLRRWEGIIAGRIVAAAGSLR